MRTKVCFAGCLICLCFVLGVATAVAQDTLVQQPLMQMLARVPDTATSRSEIYFNDRRAIETAYPPARMPKDWAEFSTLNGDNAAEQDMLPLAVWWRVWMNNNSSLMSTYFMLSGDLPAVVGFDTFNINQELNYGQPPQQAIQLTGNFDMDTVRAAFRAQGFVNEDRSEVELWCGPEGCDSGAKFDPLNRNPANPFGGDLGRKWPLLMQDDSLTSSPDLTVIEEHVAVSSGTLPSLADAPEYQAAVEAVTAQGVLLQAYFWDGEILGNLGEPLTLLADPRLSQEQIKELVDRLLENYETLPRFELLLFADTATDGEQAARVALVYSDQTAAQQAADLLPKRIANYQSLRVNLPFTDLLQERGVDNVDVQVVETAAGKSVVLLTFATPKATPEQILEFAPGNSEPADVTAPGLIYRLLVQGAITRDLGWLSTVPREALEALAGG